MDVIQQCIKDETIIHSFIIKESVSVKFREVVKKNKLAGSNVVEQLIIEWMKRQESDR